MAGAVGVPFMDTVPCHVGSYRETRLVGLGMCA
jgi:hypothetical protein